MRTVQLLLFASRALGRSNPGSAETCGLRPSTPFDSGPVCFPGPEYLSGQCQNGGDCASPRPHAWTRSSPCFQSAESEDRFCVFTDAAFADGRGISLVTTAQRANHVATAPAFTNPELTKHLNQDLVQTVPARHEVREIPGKGMGVVATAPIPRGALILANTASILVDYRAYHTLPTAHYTDLQTHAAAHLPPAHRAALLNLSSHNPRTNPPADPADISGILATNIFDIDFDTDIDIDIDIDLDLDPEDEEKEEESPTFAALFPAIARLNHACRPNADYRFDHAALAQSVRAARDIVPGEEITVSYIDAVRPRAARVRRLKRGWGFECDCALCVLEGGRQREADERVGLIGEVKGVLGDWAWHGAGGEGTGMAELLVGLFEMERLWTVMHEAYALAALEFNAVGERWRAVKYARLAVEWGIPMVGDEDEDVEDMRELAGDPRGHWSWMRRVRNRDALAK
ncbi:SET domain-containing protein [Trichocladium antarcticum]|uniref:SET domain-containing protein n=1 Tax=Trichocladium antarcticum TaxID=1450529 RepID=A0AAN6ULQ0_9PEZI|nr:SET domain-containing protein [Trichocladium antarcticum]